MIPRFHELMIMDKTRADDAERLSLFWILAQNDDLYKKVKSIYDFEDHSIKLECLNSPKVDFCSSSRALIRLGFNLYNGYAEERCDVSAVLGVLDEKNFRIAIRAMAMRFNKQSILMDDWSNNFSCTEEINDEEEVEEY